MKSFIIPSLERSHILAGQPIKKKNASQGQQIPAIGLGPQSNCPLAFTPCEEV